MMLTTDLQKGGLPLRIVRLARHLRDSGHIEPIVGCLAPRGPLSAALDACGIETFACDARGALDWAALRRLAGHLRRIGPDLIHASLFHANLAARLVGRLDRPRPLLTATVTIEIERRWHRWLEAQTAGQSDLHVANSAAVARHLQEDLGFSPDRLRVIPNGLDLDEIDATVPADRAVFGFVEDAPLIVWAGRMDPVKNLEKLVEVVDRVRRRVAVQVLLLGDGPMRSCIERLVKMRHMTQCVRLVGWRENVVAWLKSADVLLFPSRTEGSPNVVLEAMAARCPIVASDVPAIREMIGPSTAGDLVGPDDVAGFAARVLRLLSEPALAMARADRARLAVEVGHAMPDVVARWLEAYDSLFCVR